MLILAIEQSGSPCSAAVTRDGAVLAEETWVPDGFRNQHLFSVMPALLARAGVNAADVDVFALGRGPGAFTALRMAAACLAGLAVPGGKPVRGIPSCEAAAAELAAEGYPAPLVIVGDARRQRLWHARFPAGPDATDRESPPTLIRATALREALARAATVASPDWERLRASLQEAVKDGVRIVEKPAVPRAATIARLAGRHARAGGAQPPVPIYLTEPTAARPRFPSEPRDVAPE